MLAALVLVAAFDVVFAVDSIPAIFAVTRDTFVVYAANAFSLLGLASLYFVLAGMIGRFRAGGACPVGGDCHRARLTPAGRGPRERRGRRGPAPPRSR